MLDFELNNIYYALEFGLSQNENEAILNLIKVLWRFWELRGYLYEGRNWLKLVLDKSTFQISQLTAQSFFAAGRLAWAQVDYYNANINFLESFNQYTSLKDKKGAAASLYWQGIVERDKALGSGRYTPNDLVEASTLFDRSLKLFQELEDKVGISDVFNSLGILHYHYGNSQEALAYFEKSLSSRRAIGSKREIVDSLNSIANILVISNENSDQIEKIIQESYNLSLEIGYKRGQADILGLQAFLAKQRGDIDQAQMLLFRSMKIYEDLGQKIHIALSLGQYALILYLGGDPGAKNTIFKALRIWRELNNKICMANCLESLAIMFAKEGNIENASRLFGSVDSAGHIIIQGRWGVVVESERQKMREFVRVSSLNLHWKEGFNMSLEEAITYLYEDSIGGYHSELSQIWQIKLINHTDN